MKPSHPSTLMSFSCFFRQIVSPWSNPTTAARPSQPGQWWLVSALLHQTLIFFAVEIMAATRGSDPVLFLCVSVLRPPTSPPGEVSSAGATTDRSSWWVRHFRWFVLWIVYACNVTLMDLKKMFLFLYFLYWRLFIEAAQNHLRAFHEMQSYRRWIQYKPCTFYKRNT